MSKENDQSRKTGEVKEPRGGDPDKSKNVGADEPDEGAEEGRGGDPDKSKRI